MSKIIGIDLGTSNSAAAVLEGAKPTIIPSAEGATVAGKAFPSVVAVTKDGQMLVGEPARRQAVTNPEGTVAAVKRKMGTKEKFTLHGKEYTPEQISAFILQKIKKDAESFLGQPVAKVVITVPAYFDDAQRQATKNAGEIAGLDVVRIINEPTAAAMAYGLDKLSGEQNILVFDLGGGTLDVTVMNISADGGGPASAEASVGKQATFEVISTSGDTKLGGTDMDKAIMDFIVSEFKSQSGIDVSSDAQALNRVREAAEKAKIELSTVLETDINLPFITADQNGPKHLQLKITRTKLEEKVKPLIDRMRGPVEQALRDSKLSVNEISKIILVGGPTRMPVIQKFVEDYIGKKVERGIDPMEAVAQGAAVQAAILGGEFKDRSVLLLDVTPLTLGVETLGGVSTPQIERNTTIPTSKTMTFSTAADSQTSVDIHVLQGERPMAADNKSLGRFILDGIMPAPRGVPKIDVSFDIDANGILTVKASDQATGKSQHITIQGSSNLSKEEIERMKKEAEANAAEDRAKRELIETRNQADQVIAITERTLKDAGEKVSEEQKKAVEEKVSALKAVKDGNDLQAIKTAMDALSGEIQKIGEGLYSQNTQASAPDGGQATPNPQEPQNDQPAGENKTVDAEYQEVKQENPGK